MRLDAYLAQEYPKYSRSAWAKLIRRGDVRVNREIAVSVSLNVTESDEVTVKENAQKPEGLDLPIIYEDDNVIVINKPAGVLTHAKGALNEESTVADFIRSRTSLQDRVLQENNRFGIVHRLDRATSGVLIGAKNDETRKFLQKQFAERKAKKTYLAIVEQVPTVIARNERRTRPPHSDNFMIDLPIARSPKKPSTFRVDPKGKPAVTDYRVMRVLKNGTALVELKPLTGRTHQLRVHLAYIGAPIVGDPLYNFAGSEPAKRERMFLHAASLEITIPAKPENLRKTFVAELPNDFQAKIKEGSDE
ncbi:RluA family pseudouridine synthase [Candidatus Saccharibacteria bacterium]|nr:RluA family pseudouridine synthase [Candidatus Saccharibacteria bacterium]